MPPVLLSFPQLHVQNLMAPGKNVNLSANILHVLSLHIDGRAAAVCQNRM
jgi:hypothetical protein